MSVWGALCSGPLSLLSFVVVHWHSNLSADTQASVEIRGLEFSA